MGFTNPITAAQLAAALTATTLTVTGTVTTTNSTPTPGTDEDVVRSYTQAQINALSATDKSTNFVIWNKTTLRENLCVDGAVIDPTPTPVAGTSTALQSIPITTSGQQITLASNLDIRLRVGSLTVYDSASSAAGGVLVVLGTGTLVNGWEAVSSANGIGNGFDPGTVTATIRNSAGTQVTLQMYGFALDGTGKLVATVRGTSSFTTSATVSVAYGLS